MALSEHIIRDFKRRDSINDEMSYRQLVVESLDRSAFTVEYIHEHNPSAQPHELARGELFGLILKPGAAARRLFGFDREILLWCSTYKEFQARDTSAMQEFLDVHSSRLSKHAAVLVTRYESDARNTYEEKTEHSIVHFSLAELKNDGLDALLARNLYTRDLFDVTGATVAASDFFGRREIIDRIVGEVTTGTSQIGVFGLRKVGKTSLLNRLSDKLRNSNNVITARLDLQWTVSVNASPEYTLWSLGESLYAAHRSIKRISGFKLFGIYSMFSELPNSHAIWELFAHDYKILITTLNKRFCFLIDEIERMFEDPVNRGFVRFWRFIRGLDQQTPGRLRIVIGGTSPQCAQLSLIEGEDNPMFNYLQIEYLGPLEIPDAQKLLTDVGRLMGLHFQQSGLEWAIEQCGGHPALLRSLGSVVHHSSESRRDPLDISREYLETLESELNKRVAPVIDQMIAALSDQYGDEFDLLSFLAEGKISQFRAFSLEFPNEVQRLVQYGLICVSPSPVVQIRQLHGAILRSKAGRLREFEIAGIYESGDTIGSWKVVDCLASGGYADVYKVCSIETSDVAAAKIIRGGNLSYLQREIDVLAEINHPGIVKNIDTLQTDKGMPCLIMEFIPGTTVAEYCLPHKGPSGKTWFEWATSLLDALIVLHPDSRKLDHLLKRDTMDTQTYMRWSKAKHGYIHRDIKLENIMICPARGPVLIDFNISVRSGSPVRTTSSTSGYLPLRIDVVWGTSTDLYALGVTLLELAAGNRLIESSITELKEVARSRQVPEIVEIVDKLLSAPDTDISALEVRKFALRQKQAIYSSAK